MDKERILSKLDELQVYLNELRQIRPKDYLEYVSNIEKKRACERLLQIMIECVIDVCMLLVKELKLGLPGEETDILEKLERKGIITAEMKSVLKRMKGFRNILVHRYGEIDDELVFENLQRLEDFERFKELVLSFLKRL